MVEYRRFIRFTKKRSDQSQSRRHQRNGQLQLSAGARLNQDENGVVPLRRSAAQRLMIGSGAGEGVGSNG